jgi:pentapeptide MXKDX repeat protein
MKKHLRTILITTVFVTVFGAATAHSQDQMEGDKKPAGKMADNKMRKGKAMKSKKPKKERMKDGDRMSKNGKSTDQ